jgi:hypothetical protein
MDPYTITQLFTARRDDLVREADEFRRARAAKDVDNETRPTPAPRRSGSRQLRIAG